MAACGERTGQSEREEVGRGLRRWCEDDLEARGGAGQRREGCLGEQRWKREGEERGCSKSAKDLEVHLEEAAGVLGVVRGEDLETGHGGVPAGEALGVLGSHSCGSTVGAAEDDGAVDLAARHVVGLGSRVDELREGRGSCWTGAQGGF